MTIATDWRKTQAELGTLLEQIGDRAEPFPLRKADWRPTMEKAKPVVHAMVANRWWRLPIDDAEWAQGRRAAYAKIASGAGIAGELFLSRERGAFLCRTRAWLPREDAKEEIAAAGQLRQWVRSQRLDRISLGGLREAVRANLVSFPSQVPGSQGCTEPDLERRVVLLYFVFGWSLIQIGNRYAMSGHRARRIVDRWRDFAVARGYVVKVRSVALSFVRGAAAAGPPFSEHPGK
jgi:hypothetical protein